MSEGPNKHAAINTLLMLVDELPPDAAVRVRFTFLLFLDRPHALALPDTIVTSAPPDELATSSLVRKKLEALEDAGVNTLPLVSFLAFDAVSRAHTALRKASSPEERDESLAAYRAIRNKLLIYCYVFRDLSAEIFENE